MSRSSGAGGLAGFRVRAAPRRLLATTLCLSLVAVPLAGQGVPRRWTSLAVRPSFPRDTTSRATADGGDVAALTVQALLGAFLGATAGARITWAVKTRGCGGDCALDASTENRGIAIGIVPGAALGAVLPVPGGTCGFGRRLVVATFGSALGGAIGGLAGLPRSAGTALWLEAGGSVVGSVVAVHRCR